MVRVDPKPPDPRKLLESRELRLKQIQMKYIIYDIMWYFIFVIILLSVAYGNKDTAAYGTTLTMANYFEGNTYTNWIEPSQVRFIFEFLGTILKVRTFHSFCNKLSFSHASINKASELSTKVMFRLGGLTISCSTDYGRETLLVLDEIFIVTCTHSYPVVWS